MLFLKVPTSDYEHKKAENLDDSNKKDKKEKNEEKQIIDNKKDGDVKQNVEKKVTKIDDVTNNNVNDDVYDKVAEDDVVKRFSFPPVPTFL